MGFQILDKNNTPIDLKSLDKEAAEFWNKEVEIVEYANPSPKLVRDTSLSEEDQRLAVMRDRFNQRINWFDSIGWHIHDNTSVHNKVYDGKGTITWLMVKESMLINSIFNIISDPVEKLEIVRKIWEPYFNLIDHWEAKEYIPKQIKE